MDNNFELLSFEGSLNDVFELSNFIEEKTNVEVADSSVNNKMLTSLLIGAALVTVSHDAEAKGIELVNTTTEKSLTITAEYNKNIEIPFAKYIDDIGVISCSALSKRSVVKDILSFKSLNESWDGFDSIPLEVESASNAIELIDLVGEKTFCSIDDYYPNPNGTISLEWENELDEKISVEVGNNSFSYYVDFTGADVKFFNNQNIDFSNAKRLSEFIQVL